MFKYRCTSRSKILIYLDSEIKEIYPNQIIEIDEYIRHPYLTEIKDEVKINKRKRDIEDAT